MKNMKMKRIYKEYSSIFTIIYEGFLVFNYIS